MADDRHPPQHPDVHRDDPSPVDPSTGAVRARLKSSAVALARSLALKERADRALAASEQLMQELGVTLRRAEPLTSADRGYREQLARAVRDLAAHMRAAGAPPQEVVVAVKSIVADAVRTELPLPLVEQVLAEATQRAIDAYYSVA